MLDEKDKIILEHLIHDCKITTKELAKATNLSRSTIVYRIQNLEKNKYILRYDAMLDYNKFSLSMDLFFVTVPKPKRIEFKNYCNQNKAIATLAIHFNKKNYSITTFATNQEIQEIEQYLKSNNLEYFYYKTSNLHFPQFSIFDNITIKHKPSKYTNKIIKLDQIDIKILEKLSNGGGKLSILELAREIQLTPDLVLYRYKKLKQAGYFPLILAQINIKKFNLNISLIHLKTKTISKNTILKTIQKINKSIWFGQSDEENYFTTIIFKNYQEYQEIQERIYEELEENMIHIESYALKEWLFLNRVDLGKVLE